MKSITRWLPDSRFSRKYIAALTLVATLILHQSNGAMWRWGRRRIWSHRGLGGQSALVRQARERHSSIYESSLGNDVIVWWYSGSCWQWAIVLRSVQRGPVGMRWEDAMTRMIWWSSASRGNKKLQRGVTALTVITQSFTKAIASSL